MDPACETKPNVLIGRFIEQRRRANIPISIASAVSALRAMIPRADLEDDELAEMVEIAAVQSGHPVSFDADLLKVQRRH